MHPELLSMSLFMLVTSCSPGPNNIVASYSAFNYGITKTIPHMFGVIFGFTTLVAVINFGLINIFKMFPMIQEVLKYTGSIFLVYLAYKIAFSKSNLNDTAENPVKFIETFFFQFLNPKGVIVAIIIVNLLKSVILNTQKITISDVENFNSCNKKVCNWLDWFSKLKIPLKILKEKSRRKNTNKTIKYKFENEAKIVEANISDSLFATKLKFFK